MSMVELLLVPDNKRIQSAFLAPPAQAAAGRLNLSTISSKLISNKEAVPSLIRLLANYGNKKYTINNTDTIYFYQNNSVLIWQVLDTESV